MAGNREHLKNSKNADCVVTNHNKFRDMPGNHTENHKLIDDVAVCSSVSSRLIGFLLVTQ